MAVTETYYYKLREKDRALLRKPFGKVITRTDYIKKLVPAGAKVFAVGDRTSFELLKSGIKVQSFFYDCLEKRSKTEKDVANFLEDASGFEERTVKNPAGTVSRELLNAALDGMRKRLKVKVIGEEDLATLALFSVLEYGSIVAYGIPLEGMCVAEVNGRIRMVARELLHGP